MKNRILRSASDLDSADIRALYDGFDHPIAYLDCGQFPLSRIIVQF
jgi:hypothetical protein